MKVILVLFLLFASATEAICAGNTWIQRADFPANGRHRGTAVSIGNKGYMGLGHYNGAGPNIVLKDWWQFDPATNSWSQKADYIGNNGNGNYAVLAFGMTNYGYIGGGQLAVNTSFYRYDPLNNTWQAMANSPTISMNTAGFVINNKGYYLSGSTLYEYTETTNSWTSKGNAPFNVATWNSAFTINDKGYVKSGFGLFEYKQSTNQWISRAPFPGHASAGSVAFTQNNKGYIVAGYGTWLSDLTSEVWEFNPANNQWTMMNEFEGTSRRFSSGFNIGNRCYIGTGTNGTNFSDFWEFDALANLEEEFDINQFKIYPNPATEFVKFESGNLNDFEVHVFNQNGGLISKLSTNNHQVLLERNNLSKGIYYFSILSGDKVVYTNKFIFK